MKLYFISAFFIIGWWTFTLTSSLSFPPGFSLHDFEALSPNLQKATIQKALNGDFELMIKLINTWDNEAAALEQIGIKNILRLTPTQLKKSKKLFSSLKNLSKSKIVDDLGITVECLPPNALFLPQTYMSASILLALLPPEQIAALPRSLRRQTTLFPQERTEKIPWDLDCITQEKLFLKHPDLAFVAHYSNPTIIAALKAQNISLFTIKNLSSVQEIQSALLRIGHVIHKPCEAELLNLFIDASLIAIENHLKATISSQSKSLRLLYLTFYGRFSTPTSQSLTGDLLNRLFVNIECLSNSRSTLEEENGWTIPITSERIAEIKPEGIIIAIPRGKNKNLKFIHMLNESCFSDYYKNDRLFVVDDEIQQSPSQYLVLAYFDIAMAINKMISH